MYRAFLPHSWHHDLGMMATVLVVAVAILALRRLPPGPAARPAIRPAVAVCAAWLFLWPYQLPWYDAMIICVLVLYPASRLDWLVRPVTLVALSNMPGNPYLQHSHLLLLTDHFAVRVLAPAACWPRRSPWWRLLRAADARRPAGPSRAAGLTPPEVPPRQGQRPCEGCRP